MILLVDVGNSALKWATLEAGGLDPGGHAYLAGADAAALMDDFCSDLPVPDRVVVAGVGPDAVNEALRQAAARHWAVEAEFLRSSSAAGGVVNAYSEPERLGIDRWAALVAARADGRRAACIVDCGTAATVDVLDAGGTHLGGLIIPGLGLMRRALEGGTQIRSVEPLEAEGRVALFAGDTYDAIQGGSLYALVAFIDRVAADVAVALGEAPQGYVTGGDASAVLPLLGGRWEHRPDMVLEGLALLAEEDACGS